MPLRSFETRGGRAAAAWRIWSDGAFQKVVLQQFWVTRALDRKSIGSAMGVAARSVEKAGGRYAADLLLQLPARGSGSVACISPS